MSVEPGGPHPEAAVAPGYLVNHAAQLFNRLADDALRPHGMSLALLAPVLLLHWKGSMLQRDMVRFSAVRQPAMVALLDKLERMQIVTRSKVIEDRRAAIVHLTDKGREMALRGGQVLVGLNISGMTGFSPQDAALLVHLLQRFIENLSA